MTRADHAQEAIAEAIYNHEWRGVVGAPFGRCDCGWQNDGDHAKHQAEAVIQTIRGLPPTILAALVGNPS